MFKKFSFCLAICSLILAACNNSGSDSQDKKSAVRDSSDETDVTKNFQDTVDGKATGLYILKNKKNVMAVFTNYGGRLVSLLLPTKNNTVADVVVGMKSV